MTRTTRTSRRNPWAVILTALFAVMTMLGALTISGALPAGAKQGGGDDGYSITLCHATSSQSNPYTNQTVSGSSIDEVTNLLVNGHGDHVGPIFAVTEPPMSDWGDIIPAFGTYPGLNWTADGQAIHANGCKLPEVPTFEASQGYCAVSGDAFELTTASVPKTYASQAAADAALVTVLEGIAGGSPTAVIPEFSTFAGSNWDADGQALYEAGCVKTTPPPTYEASLRYCTVTNSVYSSATASVPKEYATQELAYAALEAKLPTVAASEPNAIIPEYRGFAGSNWTTANQAIYNNDCKVTTPTTPPPTTPPATTTPAAVIVTATPSPATVEVPVVVTASPAAGTVEEPVAVTAEPAKGTVAKPKPVTGRPLPASVPAGGGSSATHVPAPYAPWGIALIVLGAIGLLGSTTWLAARR